jgi:hypothetical protein
MWVCAGAACCVVAAGVVVSESLAQETSAITTTESAKIRRIDFFMARIVVDAAGQFNRRAPDVVKYLRLRFFLLHCGPIFFIKSEPHCGNAKAGEICREGIKNGGALCRLSGRAKSGLAAKRRQTSERGQAICATTRLATPFLQRRVLRNLR